MLLNSSIIPAKAGIHVGALRRICRYVATWMPACAGMTVLFISSAHAQEKELPGANLDQYMTDMATTIALQDKYPVGTKIGPLLKAMEISIPAMTCTQLSEEAYSCSGRSLFRGDFIYKKMWTVEIKAPGGKLAEIKASSNTTAVKDETELMMGY